MKTPIQSAGEAMPRKTIADLFEAPIDDARRMASILADLLEDAVGKDLTNMGYPDRYHLTSDQRENLFFSIYKTQDYIRGIQAAFDEVLK
ncbi:hypothetical protein [Pararhizobium qamdonense]|uniref:hypothetical protein n=1 Tax=Pararhizobium qamdonense TaxID=3031126 RepID=UPI0023E29F24|nr:hypothetical protein [Pararhizobium qamdonense]